MSCPDSSPTEQDLDVIVYHMMSQVSQYFNKESTTLGSVNTRAIHTEPSFAIALSKLDEAQHRKNR